MLVRVRLPGGLLAADQLLVLTDIAVTRGDGNLELTSRANIQIRALGEDSIGPVASQLAAAGLLPSASHERTRNILASPLAGRVPPGCWDVRPVVHDLDRRLIAEPELAGLSGRFLFGLDDGSADVLPLRPDLGLFPVSRQRLALFLAGADSGLRLSRGDAVPALVAAARAFLSERTAQACEAWRLDGLAAGPVRVRTRLVEAAVLDLEVSAEPVTPPARPARPVGPVADVDGLMLLGVHVPLGSLSQEQARLLAALSDGLVTVTPWRSVVLDGIDPALTPGHLSALRGAGLVTDPNSGWPGMTACAGQPGCGKARADVRADATAMVTDVDLARVWAPDRSAASSGPPAVHWAGCERRCGRPADAVIEVLAMPDGSYEVSARGRTWPARTPGETAAAIAQGQARARIPADCADLGIDP